MVVSVKKRRFSEIDLQIQPANFHTREFIPNHDPHDVTCDRRLHTYVGSEAIGRGKMFRALLENDKAREARIGLSKTTKYGKV